MGASFIQKVDSVLFEMLGRSALTAGELPCNDAEEARQMGLQVVMITAVADALPKVGPKSSQPCQWWVCWLSNRRVFFNVSSLLCSTSFPVDEGAMDIDDASKQDASHQVRVDWMVRRVANATELNPSRGCVGSAKRTAVTVGPDALRRARMKLKVLCKFNYRRDDNTELV